MNAAVRALEPMIAVAARAWIADQRDRHRPRAAPIAADPRAALEPFFGDWILDPVRVRVVERLEPPAFVTALRRLGIHLPIELDRLAGIAFVDTVILMDAVPESRRTTLLFHELVHVVQYHLLGLRGFVERYAREWLEAGRVYRDIPLEADAYALAARFARAPGEPFDAVAEVERRLLAGVPRR